jgi:hypothetical protein
LASHARVTWAPFAGTPKAELSCLKKETKNETVNVPALMVGGYFHFPLATCMHNFFLYKRWHHPIFPSSELLFFLFRFGFCKSKLHTSQYGSWLLPDIKEDFDFAGILGKFRRRDFHSVRKEGVKGVPRTFDSIP